MELLVLKLVLVPLFLSLVSLASARWGPAVGGWLAGLPVVGGPILFLLALERGTDFVAGAAISALNGLCGAIAFALVYAWAATRLGWLEAANAAIGAWLVVAAILSRAQPPLIGSVFLVVTILVVVPRLFPSPQRFSLGSGMKRRELVLRMIAGAALTLFTTAVAKPLGPQLTGIIAVFPIMTLVLAVFSQRNSGVAFVVTLLRSMMGGLYSFVGFCVVLAVGMRVLGIYLTFALAVLVALCLHWGIRELSRLRLWRL